MRWQESVSYTHLDVYKRQTQDNVEHTFFNCDTWAKRKASLLADIGTTDADNIVGAMLRAEGVLNHMAHYLEGTLWLKKGDLERL